MRRLSNAEQMYKAHFLSPMIPSYDLAVTGRFFTDLLGFTLSFQSPTYAIYQKDHLTVHLLPASEDIGQMEFYLEVDDVDGLWVSIKEKVQGLKVREPFNQEYMMREVHIEVPATKTLLMVGQELKG